MRFLIEILIFSVKMETNLLKLFALLLPVLCVLSGPIKDAVDPTMRVDCAPDPNVGEDVCKSRGCMWSPVSLQVKRCVKMKEILLKLIVTFLCDF